jgi:hypothetical protein
MMMRTACTGLALLALAGTAADAAPEMRWSTIDGGAETMSGAGYTLKGSAGQHDAGPASAPATGSGYGLRGGFWQLPLFSGSGACNEADIAEPFGLLDLSDISAFIAGFTANDPIADLDGNGLLDLGDISVFIGAFTAGCP